MATVLVTGSTGFVGSALAARLLGAGLRVLALSRNDADGARTRASVHDAAEGFGITLGDAASTRLVVLDAGAQGLDSVLGPAVLGDVVAAWHAAAEMSYASQKVLESYDTNVVATCRLYRLLAERAPACRRFFYVSTAYTAGMQGGLVHEELHAGMRYDNAYQLSKCMAEHALAEAQRQQPLAVTLFRPTIVVGHAGTGWARRNGFGFNMFIEALAAMGKAGIGRVHLALNAEARPDLIPIDRLAEDALALTLQAERGAGLQVLHCAGGLGPRLEEVLRTIGQPSGVDVRFGTLQTAADRRVDRAIDPNRRFASTEWEFATPRLEQLLGRARRSPAGLHELDRMVRWYLAGETVRERRRAAAPESRAAEALGADALAAQPV